jgi:hypothetical protein
MTASDPSRRVICALPLALLGAMHAGAAEDSKKGAKPDVAQDKPASSGEPGGRPHMLPVDRIVVPVYRRTEIIRHEMLMFALEVADVEKLSKVLEKMPRLQNAFITEWNRLGALPEAADNGLDIAGGLVRMRQICDRHVEPGAVKRVHLTGQSTRRMQPARAG